MALHQDSAPHSCTQRVMVLSVTLFCSSFTIILGQSRHSHEKKKKRKADFDCASQEARRNTQNPAMDAFLRASLDIDSPSSSSSDPIIAYNDMLPSSLLGPAIIPLPQLPTTPLPSAAVLSPLDIATL